MGTDSHVWHYFSIGRGGSVLLLLNNSDKKRLDPRLRGDDKKRGDDKRYDLLHPPLYFQKLEATPSRNSMTEILAELFTNAGQEEIGKLAISCKAVSHPL